MSGCCRNYARANCPFLNMKLMNFSSQKTRKKSIFILTLTRFSVFLSETCCTKSYYFTFQLLIRLQASFFGFCFASLSWGFQRKMSYLFDEWIILFETLLSFEFDPTLWNHFDLGKSWNNHALHRKVKISVVIESRFFESSQGSSSFSS